MSKIIMPPKNRTAPVLKNITETANMDALIKDALAIVEKELVRFRHKTGVQDRALDLKEARVLQGYLKTLVDMSREQRDRVKDFDFEEMETEELINLLQVLIEKRKIRDSSSSGGKAD